MNIHCILLIIEQWRAEHGGKFPEEIYVQVDGGSENANRFLLAFLEFLVAKRMTKRIYYTRLPVGHTHEDIDACFALIWNWFKKVSISTPQQYKDELEAALRDSKVPTKVVDIFVVPEYKKFLLPHIDTEIGYLHRLEDTQHQWRFEAVPVHTVHFPLGVKTTYRAYASDQIVKIRKLPKLQCISRDGCLTGLEACTVLVRWEPAFNPLKGQMVEGTFLLKTLPGILLTESLSAAPFVPGSADHINETVQAAFSKWIVGTPEREKWSRWSLREAPHSDSVDVYLETHFLKIPLKSFFVYSVFYGSITDIATNEIVETEYTFEWPNALAIANASVRTERNLAPPAPYTYLIDANDTNATVARYKNDSAAYYSVVLKNKTIPMLKTMLVRKVTPTGDSISSSGVKDDLIKRLFEWDIEVIRNISRPLNVIDKNFLQTVLDYDPEADQVVVEIQAIVVNRDQMQCFNEDQPLATELLSLFMKLFQSRDNIISNSHREYNQNSRFYIQRKRSFFADPLIIGKFLRDNQSLTAEAMTYLNSLDIFNFHRLYIPIYDFEEQRLELIVVDIQLKTITYIEPTLDDSIQSMNWCQERRSFIKLATIAMLRSVQNAPEIEAQDWQCKLYSLFPATSNVTKRGCDILTQVNDCGIFLLLILDHLVNDLPLLFNSEEVKNMRRPYAYYLLKAELPIN